ncbi:TPA: hypothetical protein ACIO1X_001250, partial [Streptococcus agalactiae]
SCHLTLSHKVEIHINFLSYNAFHHRDLNACRHYPNLSSYTFNWILQYFNDNHKINFFEEIILAT